MSAKFCMFEKMSEEELNACFPKVMQKLPKKIGTFFQKKYIFRIFPIKETMIECMGETALQVKLPLTDIWLERFLPEEIKGMINAMMIEKGYDRVIADKRLKPYVEESFLIDGRAVPYCFLQEILLYTTKLYQYENKRVRIMVMDDEKQPLTACVVRALAAKWNHVVIVTERKEFWEDIHEELYDQWGLLLQITDKSNREELPCEIVLELTKEPPYLTRMYPRNAIVLDFEPSKAKKKCILAKRKDIRYYHRYVLGDGTGLIDVSVLQAVILGDTTWLWQSSCDTLPTVSAEYGICVREIT